MNKNKIVIIFAKDENGNYKYNSLGIAKNIDGDFKISSVYNESLNNVINLRNNLKKSTFLL